MREIDSIITEYFFNLSLFYWKGFWWLKSDIILLRLFELTFKENLHFDVADSSSFVRNIALCAHMQGILVSIKQIFLDQMCFFQQLLILPSRLNDNRLEEQITRYQFAYIIKKTLSGHLSLQWSLSGTIYQQFNIWTKSDQIHFSNVSSNEVTISKMLALLVFFLF